MTSVGDHVLAARTRLQTAGLSAAEAAQSANVLAQHALGWDRARLLAAWRDEAPPGFAGRFDALVARRARHEPVAYITGEREFYGRPFIVTPAVLIPRPETELIVEEALSWLAPWRCGKGVPPAPPAAAPRGGARVGAAPLVVDIGTGSGCLAVTLALECPAVRVVATDVSIAALDVAAMNAERLDAARVEFRHGSLFAGLSAPADLVVCNPPYVPASDRDALAPEVREFEPAVALFGGDSGLEQTIELLGECAEHLKPGGRLLLEIGAGQAGAIAEIVDPIAELELLYIRADLQQIPRVAVIGRRSDEP